MHFIAHILSPTSKPITVQFCGLHFTQYERLSANAPIITFTYPTNHGVQPLYVIG